MALVLRQIPNELLPLDVIGLDPGLWIALEYPRGMILVTGPTGSGKSTTLASMINIINETQDHAHIITIEDPIEFYHPQSGHYHPTRGPQGCAELCRGTAPRVASGSRSDSGG